MGIIKVSGSCPICCETLEHNKHGILWEHEFRLIRWWHCLVKHKRWILSVKDTILMVLFTLVAYPLLVICFLIKLVLFPFWWLYENL